MEEPTLENVTRQLDELTALVISLSNIIDHMNGILYKYEPMLEEASRRMAGPIRFRRNS